MSWDLLNIDNAPQPRPRPLPNIGPWDIAQADRERAFAQPFAPPQNENAYRNLDPWQRKALMKQFGVPRRPQTNKAGMADLLADPRTRHDCHCGGSCGPCASGGLGFLQPVNDFDGGGDVFAWDPFANWDFGSWFGGWFGDGSIDPFAGGGGGGGGLLLNPDECGRPVTHPDYGCPCGTLFDDLSYTCVNPCPQGQRVGWIEKRNSAGQTIYEDTCETDPNTVALVIPQCPAGTTDIGNGQCRSTSTGTVTSKPRTAAGGSGGSSGGTVSSRPARSPLPAPTAAGALGQAQALCARIGKTYDPTRRQCVGGAAATTQNPLGVAQSSIAGIPVWVWFLVGGFVVIQAVKR